MIVSITRLHLRSVRYLPLFLWHVNKTSRQIVRASGFLGGKLLVETRLAFWTMTQWATEESMRAYRNTGAHKIAMPLLFGWCDEASVVSWEMGTEPMSWEMAHHKMIEQGHWTPVKHPSAAQQNHDIPPPRPSPVVVDLKPRPT